MIVGFAAETQRRRECEQDNRLTTQDFRTQDLRPPLEFLRVSASLRPINYALPVKYLRLKLRNGTQAASVPMDITAMKISTRSVHITFTG